KVALELDIPFQVLDFKQQYKDRVVEYFFTQYEAGLTPNPDVMCNKEIKFGLFYDWVRAHGYEYLATGHYADITHHQSRSYLTAAADTHKDQTYFLYQITEEQLKHTLFPLGGMSKSQVRVEAAKREIHVADKKDSVGICFIGDIDVHAFLEERLGKNPGDVVNTAGTIIGKHEGLWFYTVGQRHGFTVDAKTILTQDDGSKVTKDNIPPFYVIAKHASNNQLVVGFGAETYSKSFIATQLHLITPNEVTTEGRQACLVRIRHTGQLLPAVLTRKSENQSVVELRTPVQGVAEGQSAVFYSADVLDEALVCLGGGIISSC
nr:tRNA 2-thiouridine(34) synthase MnmA [bacterium]